MAAPSLDRPSRIATIGAGYADGWAIANLAVKVMLIARVTAPVIGRVSMDSITVDVTDIDPAHLQHGFVELLHDDYDLSHMAGDAETIAWRDFDTAWDTFITPLSKFIKLL